MGRCTSRVRGIAAQMSGFVDMPTCSFKVEETTRNREFSLPVGHVTVHAKLTHTGRDSKVTLELVPEGLDDAHHYLRATLAVLGCTSSHPEPFDFWERTVVTLQTYKYTWGLSGCCELRENPRPHIRWEFCDTHILLSDGTTVPVHRQLLSACSPVFRAMFEHEAGRAVHEVFEVDRNTLAMFIAYCYNYSASDLWCDMDAMLRLLQFAHRMQCGSLVGLCESGVVALMTTPQLAAPVLEVAEQLALHNLSKKAMIALGSKE